MRTFDFGTKYSYTLIPSLSMYNTDPCVRMRTDHRANTKTFREQVRKVTRETGHLYSRYENDNSLVCRMGIIM